MYALIHIGFVSLSVYPQAGVLSVKNVTSCLPNVTASVGRDEMAVTRAYRPINTQFMQNLLQK
jgi:hypothetical protein